MGNYIGPDNGQGMRIYINGQEVENEASWSVWPVSAGDSRIVVGRHYADKDQHYGNAQVDELIFFDAALTSDDVQSIYNSA